MKTEAIVLTFTALILDNMCSSAIGEFVRGGASHVERQRKGS